MPGHDFNHLLAVYYGRAKSPHIRYAEDQIGEVEVNSPVPVEQRPPTEAEVSRIVNNAMRERLLPYSEDPTKRAARVEDSE